MSSFSELIKAFSHQEELTAQLQEEFVAHGRSLSLSTNALIPRDTQVSWLRRMEERLRGIYAAITCTRTSDVAHHQASWRPPRPSATYQQPRRQVATGHQPGPRPRLETHQSPRPPSPDRAGGSTWYQTDRQSDASSGTYIPISEYITRIIVDHFVTNIFPNIGGYVIPTGSSGFSEQQGGEDPTQEGYDLQTTWTRNIFGTPEPTGPYVPFQQTPFQTSQHTTFRPSQQTPFQTPPPRPTQETQPESSGMGPRDVRPVHRYEWSTPAPPPPRRGRRRAR